LPLRPRPSEQSTMIGPHHAAGAAAPEAVGHHPGVESLQAATIFALSDSEADFNGGAASVAALQEVAAPSGPLPARRRGEVAPSAIGDPQGPTTLPRVTGLPTLGFAAAARPGSGPLPQSKLVPVPARPSYPQVLYVSFSATCQISCYLPCSTFSESDSGPATDPECYGPS